MRLFIAIDLPDFIKTTLHGVSCGLPGARWILPEQMHLTLRFIGEVDSGQSRDIHAVLDGIGHPGFSMHLQGIGFFPPRGRPRVLWAGVVAEPLLLHLQRKIETRLVQAGFPPERRKFAPHVTLARLKTTPPSRVGRFLQLHNLFTTPSFPVDRFGLYSSVLGRKGASHYLEATYRLAPGPAADHKKRDNNQ